MNEDLNTQDKTLENVENHNGVTLNEPGTLNMSLLMPQENGKSESVKNGKINDISKKSLNDIVDNLKKKNISTTNDISHLYNHIYKKFKTEPSNHSNILMKNLPQKRRRPCKPVSADKKDAKYYEKRKLNNEAAKKSRNMRKEKETKTIEYAKVLEKQCANYEDEIKLLNESVIRLQSENLILKSQKK
ncbi:hypothetical protein A3Q56_00720 [Intoshia linei]|uniref:BZIP domain-containing protein n=1 Tax=Intoshia linei TaxID=1819745 RepID=A0A177BBD7_9BILA|nr:hypothetical protein A3Q56_00720 [Intoshia linei]